MTDQFSTDRQRWGATGAWRVYCGQSGSIVARGLDREEAEALCQRLNAERHPEPMIRELQRFLTVH